MKREKIDLTDKELYYVALAFKSYLNNRDTYITNGGARGDKQHYWEDNQKWIEKEKP